MGSRAKFFRDDEELPVAYAIGSSYNFHKKFTVTSDCEWVRSEGGAIKAGLEYLPIDLLAVRVGYDERNASDNGLTFGLEFHVENFLFDYAFVPFGDLGRSHRVSGEINFGAVSEVKRELGTTNKKKSGAPRTASNIKLFRKSKAPTKIQILSLKIMAMEAYDKAEFDLAIQKYEEYLVLRPNNLTSRWNLAEIYLVTGAPAKSAKHYQAITKLEPNNVEAWYKLGLSREKQGIKDSARIAYIRALSLQPDNARAEKRLNNLYR